MQVHRVLFIFLGAVLFPQQPRILDLTTPGESAPSARDPLGVPGGTGIRLEFRGGDVPVVVPGYALPLKAEILSVVRDAAGILTMEVVVTNMGAGSFFMPASTDSKRSSMLAGNTGRRLIQFGARFRSPGKPDTQVIGALAEGSQTKKDSLLQIAPQQSVNVRYKIYLSAEAISLIKNNSDTSIQAEVIEKSFEDARWYLRETSAPIVSINASPVPR